MTGVSGCSVRMSARRFSTSALLRRSTLLRTMRSASAIWASSRKRISAGRFRSPSPSMSMRSRSGSTMQVKGMSSNSSPSRSASWR